MASRGNVPFAGVFTAKRSRRYTELKKVRGARPDPPPDFGCALLSGRKQLPGCRDRRTTAHQRRSTEQQCRRVSTSRRCQGIDACDGGQRAPGDVEEVENRRRYRRPCGGKSSGNQDPAGAPQLRCLEQPAGCPEGRGVGPESTVPGGIEQLDGGGHRASACLPAKKRDLA